MTANPPPAALPHSPGGSGDARGAGGVARDRKRREASHRCVGALWESSHVTPGRLFATGLVVATRSAPVACFHTSTPALSQTVMRWAARARRPSAGAKSSQNSRSEDEQAL